jgi:hypothetical protein
VSTSRMGRLAHILPVVLAGAELIQRIAESYNSRKLPLRIVQPYAVGSGQNGLKPRSSTPKSRHLDTPSYKTLAVYLLAVSMLSFR